MTRIRQRAANGRRQQSLLIGTLALLICCCVPQSSVAFISVSPQATFANGRHQQQSFSPSGMHMVLSHPSSAHRQSSSSYDNNNDDNDETAAALSKKAQAAAQAAAAAASRLASKQQQEQHRHRRKYRRSRIPESERQLRSLRQRRQAAYEQIVKEKQVNIWSFESLFPEPVWDEESIQRDLYAIQKQDRETYSQQQQLREAGIQTLLNNSTKTAVLGGAVGGNNNPNNQTVTSTMRPVGGSSMMRIWRGSESKATPLLPANTSAVTSDSTGQKTGNANSNSLLGFATSWLVPPPLSSPPGKTTVAGSSTVGTNATTTTLDATALSLNATNGRPVDKDMTRLVEDRLYGPPSSLTGKTSLLQDGAVQFREGVRLGRPLKVNADRLTYLAKKELSHGRVEEAKELYEQAMQTDPSDGRPYLGLARCAERRRDFALARDCLTSGIAQSVAYSVDQDDFLRPDRGPNPFLLQALGCLEERMGNLAKAEACYVQACKSRPWHAAAWVSLGRLRTLKLGQSATAGRKCYQAAERELAAAGEKPSSHVYTAWASLEHKRVGDTRRARELYLAALEVDPKCSAAWLQLGVMEGECENYDDAQECFESGLKHDRRNSRLLQAYALMETKRPEGSSRKAIGLFERALAANPRDAGVLQAYALYVAELGDVSAARDLLQRGTVVNKRHAPVWQAWGVLEARQGFPEKARTIFQQGIWACAQPTGSQSGGYPTARLWQAWGVLEAQQGDPAAARRCFSRALDADSRNVPTITAWALMEEQLNNVADARAIYERALKKFMAGTADKMTMWRSYELMEERMGNLQAAKQVFERSMRDALAVTDDSTGDDKPNVRRKESVKPKKKSTEVEVIRWASHDGEVWMNDRAIESKVRMKNNNNKPENRKKP